MRGSAGERFWLKVDDTTSECWLWQAAVNASGYGIFSPSASRSALAHRFAYQLSRGPIARGLCVCHRCDNPKCVRPDHLFLGTVADNNRDRDEKGRTKDIWKSGQCARGHDITKPENVYAYPQGRRCVQCAAIVARDAYERKKTLLHPSGGCTV